MLDVEVKREGDTLSNPVMDDVIKVGSPANLRQRFSFRVKLAIGGVLALVTAALPFTQSAGLDTKASTSQVDIDRDRQALNPIDSPLERWLQDRLFSPEKPEPQPDTRPLPSRHSTGPITNQQDARNAIASGRYNEVIRYLNVRINEKPSTSKLMVPWVGTHLLHAISVGVDNGPKEDGAGLIDRAAWGLAQQGLHGEAIALSEYATAIRSGETKLPTSFHELNEQYESYAASNALPNLYAFSTAAHAMRPVVINNSMTLN